MKKQWISFALLSIATVAHAAQEQPIRLVGPLDLSGGAAEVGRDALAGIQFAVEELNQKGGVLGRQLVFEYQDAGSNPQRAISQANSLLRDGAALLLSPQSSAGALAVSKAVAARQRVPTCVGVSVIDDITMKDFNPYVYSMTPTSYMEGRAQAERFAELPYRRYAIITADYAGGRAGVSRFRDHLKKIKPDVEIVVEEYPKFGATDYTASINKLLAAKPDYVFSSLFGADLLTFSKQAASVDFFKEIDHKFMALYDLNTLKAMGGDAPVGTEGWQRAPANYLRGQSEEAKAFIDGYRSKHGSYPSDWTIMTYDCVMVWAQAATAAKSIEPEAVMSAIEDGEFNSARGAFKVGKLDHQAEVPSYIGKVEVNSEFGQPVLNIQHVVPAAVSRPSEEALKAARGSK